MWLFEKDNTVLFSEREIFTFYSKKTMNWTIELLFEASYGVISQMLFKIIHNICSETNILGIRQVIWC